MADKKIEDATRVSSVTGTEILPASVSSAAKSLTTAQVKDYVMAAIRDLSDIDDWSSTDGDKVLIKTSSQNKYVTFSIFVDNVFQMLMSKDAASTLQDTNKLILAGESGVEKSVEIGTLKNYIINAIGSNIDIHSLTAADTSDTSDEFAAYKLGSVNANRKVTVSQLAEAICGQTAAKATERSTALTSTDYLLIGEPNATTGQPDVLKKVLLGTSGVTAQNRVIAPNANTDGDIPQWNGTNSKTLKNGLSLATSVSSSSTNAAVPTALAVHNAVSDKVIAPSTTTHMKIPLWYGNNTKTLSDGYAVASSISSTTEYEKIPNEAAVMTQIVKKVTAPLSTTSGCVPKWSSTQKQLDDGFAVVTEVRADGSDEAIPTEEAVREALDLKVAAPATTTESKIPQWDSTQKKLKDGLSLVTTFGSSGDNTSVLSSGAVITEVLRRSQYHTTAIETISDLPSASNFKNGDFIVARKSLVGFMLFVCVSSNWFYVATLQSEIPS